MQTTKLLCSIAISLSAGLMSFGAYAQVQPLGTPPVPPGNPLTTAKINLGKALFWEEQLSLTGTVACGTCHRPNAAGTDPRTAVFASLASFASTHPGPDGSFGGPDDVHASMGVPAHNADGLYRSTAAFGLAPQVGGRKSPSSINSGFSPQLLFWDGRAGTSFSDPITGLVLIPNGASLENQALMPLLDSAEMAPAAALISDVPMRLQGAKPLALASNIPATLSSWIGTRDYPALFTEAFGSPEITPTRIAFAIASYERTQNANQTPFDDLNAGNQAALTAQEQRGLNIFRGNECADCHAGALLSDNSFRYIGVRPAADDLGRFNQTGNVQNRGQFRVPSLRNVEQRAPYMHNGRFSTLEQVVDFYARGGDFNEPNKDPRVRPRNIPPNARADLVAFLKRPLTDVRVATEQPPFDRPTLYTESDRVPQILGQGSAGQAGLIPQIAALEPPLLGNTNFTVSVTAALPNAQATLVVGDSDPGLPSSSQVPLGSFANVALSINPLGYASTQLALPNDSGAAGRVLFGRIYVADPAAPNQLASTQAFRVTLFGTGVDALLINGFE